MPFLAIALITLAAIFATLYHYVLEPHTSVQPNVQFTEFRYHELAGRSIDDFVSKTPGGAVLLKRTTPRDLQLGIVFPATKTITALITTQYEKVCENKPQRATIFSMRGPTFDHRVKLFEGDTHRIAFSVERGTRLKFNYVNRAGPECSHARVVFFEQPPAIWTIFGLLALWMLIALLCYALGTSQLIPVLGAAFTSLLLMAETTLGELPVGSLSFYTLSGLGMSGLLLVFSAIPIRSRLLSLLATLLILACFALPLTFVCYQLLFSGPVTTEIIHAILQTYSGQAIEFWGEYLGLTGTLIAGTVFFAFYLFLSQINRIQPRALASLTTGLLLLLISSYQVVEPGDRSGMLNLVSASAASYKYEIEQFKNVANERSLKPVPATLDPLFADNISVFVIGESVNKNHMSSYGYVRPTTPNMDRLVSSGEAIKFTNAYSNHTHSNPTMSYVLTQANQYNQIDWVRAPSVLQLIRSTPLRSTWLTSHRMMGGWSNKISAIASEADSVYTINKKIGLGNNSSKVDGELLPYFTESLSAASGQAIFMHFYNSHQGYCSRYPAAINEFFSDLTPIDFSDVASGESARNGSINCYDNSVFYTDQLLQQVISELEKRSEPSTLMYIADHGEEVFGGSGHNSARYTFPMSDVPLFVWANRAWRAQHADLWKNLQQNRQKVFTNDLVYETTAGLMGISSSTVNPRFDASSAAYIPPKNPTSLHGRKHLDDKRNWRYWQRVNARDAQIKGVQLAAQDVDSIGKAKSALGLGIQILEINADYSSTKGVQLTDAGGRPLGIDLPDFLKRMSNSPLKTLLVNVQPPEGSSSADIERELQKTAAQFSIDIKLLSGTQQGLALADPDFIEKLNGDPDGNTQIQRVQLKTQYETDE